MTPPPKARGIGHVENFECQWMPKCIADWAVFWLRMTATVLCRKCSSGKNELPVRNDSQHQIEFIIFDSMFTDYLWILKPISLVISVCCFHVLFVVLQSCAVLLLCLNVCFVWSSLPFACQNWIISRNMIRKEVCIKQKYQRWRNCAPCGHRGLLNPERHRKFWCCLDCLCVCFSYHLLHFASCSLLPFSLAYIFLSCLLLRYFFLWK